SSSHHLRVRSEQDKPACGAAPAVLSCPPRDSGFSDSATRAAPTPWPRAGGHAATGPRRSNNAMIDLAHIDELARRLSGLVPPGLRGSREELQENCKAVLQAGLARLDLVTREEFEVQRAALLRTREKLEEPERTVARLEARLAGRPDDTS